MFENSSLSIVFFIRKLTSKIDATKVYTRIIVAGKRAKFSSNWELQGSIVLPCFWAWANIICTENYKNSRRVISEIIC